MKKIEDLIGRPALFEQLAEEASELSKAALKLARVLRRENPTPVTESEAIKSVIEEYTDVVHCAMEADLVIDPVQVEYKDERWRERIKNSILEGVIHDKQNKNYN